MDFTLPPEIEDIRIRTRAFIAAHVLPLESDPANFDPHENIRLDMLGRVQAKAKALNAGQVVALRGLISRRSLLSLAGA